MLRNTENSYGLVSRLIHRLMAAIVLIMLAVGFTMVNLEPSDQKWQIYNVHKATGLIVLALIVVRVVWILLNTTVQVPFDLPQWQRFAARWNHNFLYILLFVMPASGALMSLTGGNDIHFFGAFTIKAIAHNKEYYKLFWNTHVISAFLLVAAITVHILAALYHHFIRKDNVLMRMIRGF